MVEQFEVGKSYRYLESDVDISPDMDFLLSDVPHEITRARACDNGLWELLFKDDPCKAKQHTGWFFNESDFEEV